MFRNARKALASFGGVKSLVAVAAIGWGINVLSQIVEERKEMIAELEMFAAQQASVIQENMRKMTENDPIPFVPEATLFDDEKESDNG